MGSFFQCCYGLIQAFIFVVLGFSFASCSRINNASSVNASEAPSASTVEDSKKPGQSCFTENFQGPSLEAKPVDVLFVMETSPSMSDIRQKIIDGINTFIAGLPAHSDFNIAVLLSHGSTSSLSGKLFQLGTEPLILKSSQLTSVEIQNYLTAKLSQAPADSDSGGGEEGIFSLFNAITNPSLLSDSLAAGFFRSDAALSVVFIGDRRDICANIPAGVAPETDPLKIDARIRDCEGLTAAGLTNRLTLLKGSQPLWISGLIYADDPAPAGKEIGYGYTDMITLNHGSAIDLAHADISAGLAPILAFGGQPQNQSVYTLGQTYIATETLKVTVNGETVPYSYSNGKITITTPIPSGAAVMVSYCIKGENPYVGHCKVFENADQWDGWTLTPSTQDLELKNTSGNISVDAVQNLSIQNVSGGLSVMSAMSVSSIQSLNGNSYLRMTGDISTIDDTNSLRIDKAGKVTAVSNTKGSFQLNALSLGSYTNAVGNACLRVQTIGKIQSMKGTKTFISSQIDELSVRAGVVHVFGAVIKTVLDTSGRICLHNGAKVLNSSNITGFVGECH